MVKANIAENIQEVRIPGHSVHHSGGIPDTVPA